MTIHEPPLRSFIQEGQLVQEVVEYAITEHRETCPWIRALLQDEPAACPVVSRLRRAEIESSSMVRVHQPDMLVIDDLELVKDLSAWALKQGSNAKPPVSTNLVSLLDPGRLVYLRECAMEKRGSHRLEGDSWIIDVNRELGRKARRFTIMREGFHILYKSRPLDLHSYGAIALDWLADRFAAYVLMPEQWVKDLKPRAENLVNLAGIFQVSPTAMRIRLKELGLLN